MSSISGLGGGVQGLSQFIQSLSGASPTQATGATTSAATSGASIASDLAQAVSSGHHHHHGHGGSGILKQIQDAVTNALQTAQTGSGSTSNPNQIVESAIAQVLKANSSATTSTGTTNPATTGQATATDPDGDATGGGSSLASFFQALQTAGIDPKQFQQDFVNAIKDAQGGTVNPATAFKSIPLGSTIDALG
jgi:hypothetical protein